MADSFPNIPALIARKQIGFALTLVLLATVLLGGGQVYRFLAGGQEAAAFVARAEAAALAAAVAAPDAERVQTDLLALRADPLVTAAGVYNAQGDLLAQYRRDNAAAPAPEKPLPEGQTATARETVTSAGIWIGGQPVGALYLRRDFDWAGFSLPLLLGLAAALVLSTFLAYSHAQRLGPELAKPFSALADSTAQRLRAERDDAAKAHAGEKAELDALRDSLKQARDRGAAAERSLAAREEELAALRQRARPGGGGDGKALIRVAEEIGLLPAGPLREAALALAETAAALAADPEPSAAPFDPAALAAEAALAARLRATAKKAVVSFDAFPGTPAAIAGDGPQLLRAVSLVLNDALARSPEGGEIAFVIGVVKESLRFEIRDAGAAAALPPEAEQAVARLGAALKGKTTAAGTVRWFDLALPKA